MNEPNTPNQEVDLLAFFSAIGKMFGNFFRGIKNIFIYFFERLLWLLVFIKRNIVYLSIGIIAGLVIAFFFKDQYQKVYTAKVVVKTNFGSGAAFRSMIDSYNSMLEADDFDELAQTLHLNKEEVKSIKGFKLESEINKVLLLQEYENYLMRMDTTVYKFLKFKDYQKSILDDKDLYPYKKLTVYASKPDVFYKLNKVLPKILDDDQMLQERKKQFKLLLTTKKDENLRSFHEMDSMRRVFDKVYLEMAKQTGGSTNVVVSSDKVRGPEGPYNIFYSREFVLKNFEKAMSQYANNLDLIEMLSAFPKYGSKENPLKYNPFLKYPILGFLSVLLVLFLIEFYKYILQYEKEKFDR